jgi:polysaccharide deacetylase 2 family uncharacterized protein YibQ
MTGEEWHEYLVKLAMEAYDGQPSIYGSGIKLDMDRDAFEDRVRERMAQAAQVIAMECADPPHELQCGCGECARSRRGSKL